MKRLQLGKVTRLHRRDWGDLLAAQTALLRAQLLLWTQRRGALLTPVHTTSTQAANVGEVPPPVGRLALAIARAARHGLFRPSCLVRALALHRMLEARGFHDTSLCIGVRRQAQQLLAHAWVEYRGLVLADEEWLVKQFDELARLGMSEAS
jgi:hypothetical protein